MAILPQKAQAQATSAPDGWMALVHWYQGPYYSNELAISKIPPQSQPFASADDACVAATTFANQLDGNESYVGELSDEVEEGIQYPIFNYDLQQYEGRGYYVGYRCQLRTNGEEPQITEFGWEADAAIVVVPVCPVETGAGFFDGEVVCGREFAAGLKGKPNTCSAGDFPLTKPKRVIVGNPVAVDTGEKIEEEQDYATEDGLLNIKRWYRSAQRNPISTTEMPGFGRYWRGVLPGRLVAEGLRSGGQIYSFLMEYQTDEGDYRRFYEDDWSFGAGDVTRLKLSIISVPSDTPEAFFRQHVADVDAQGEFKLAFSNGDYILFSRAGNYNGGTDQRILVPVERGFANGYKIWFDYSDTSQYPYKMHDNLNREMTLSWEDIGWSSATLFDLRKGPSPTAPSVDAVREKAISEILLPDSTTVNYSYGAAESSGYKGRLESVTRKNALGDLLWAHTYLYEDSRFPYSITGKSDQSGNRLSTYAYDENGNAILTERAGGFDRQELSFGQQVVEHDPDTGEPLGVTEQSVTNPLGRTTRYKFVTGASNGEGGANPLNSPAQIAAVVGEATANLPEDISQTSYVDGQTVGATDANGNSSSQMVDPENRRPTTITDALGTPIEITWHPTLDLPIRTIRKRLQTDFAYDSQGQLESVSETDLDSGEVRTTQYVTGVAGRVQAINGPRVPDAQGRDDITNMTYDTHGNRLTMTDALGHVTSFESYDANGRAARIVDPNGVVTELAYDDLGRTKTVKIKHPTDVSQDATTTMDYDVEGRVSAVTRPDTSRIIFDYNLAGLLTAIRSDDGERIDYSYDPMGNPLSETVKRTDSTQAAGIARTFDELGRMLTETLGPGRTHSYQYDKVGNAVRITTARGGAYQNSFDALDRLVGTLTPDEAHFHQYYDGDALPTGGAVAAPGSSAQNELGVFEDGHGVKTGFTRNAFGQVTQEVSPDRGTTTYEYDLAGDLVAATDGRGQRVEYTRDILGRVIAKTPIGRPASEKITYKYDVAQTGPYQTGRLSRVIDGSGTTILAYDHRGNVLSERQTVGSGSTKLGFSYDLADRVVEIQYPSGRLVHYDRDSKGRVVAVRTKANINASGWTIVASGLLYEPFGAVKHMELGNGLIADSDWGNDGRLASRLLKTGAGVDISHLSYAYDEDDNMVGISDAVTPANDVAYAYDPVGRLNQVTLASAPVRRIDFGFDGNGNRVEKSSRAQPGDPDEEATIESYVTDLGSNQLDEITAPNGARSFTYDGRGNLLSESRPAGVSVNAGYDGFGRLVSYTRTGEASLTNVYNGLDDRVATEAVPTGGGTSDTRRFVYDLDSRVIGEYGTSATDVKAEFIWLNPEVGEAGQFGGDDGLGGYMPLAVATPAVGGGTVVSWVHGNHMGVPILYTNSSGTQLSGPPGDYSVPGFPGQSQTFADLYYNRYRDYDPTTGRYIQADPIGLASGDNPYSYAANNPLRYTDPTGEFIPLVIVGSALVGAGSDLALQIGMNWLEGRGLLNCIDWTQVGVSGALGAITGGVGGTGFRTAAGLSTKFSNVSRRIRRAEDLVGTANDLHHWLLPRRLESALNGRAARVVNGRWNLNIIPRAEHIDLHRMNILQRILDGSPEWAGQASGVGGASIGGGLLGDGFDGDCSCAN